jgi:WD40 repeat protein
MSAKIKSAVLFLVLGTSIFLTGSGTAQQPAAQQPPDKPAAEPLPPGALNRFGSMRMRHGSRILSLAYTSNGRILAAGGGDDPVRLWDADTGLELRQCKETWVNAMVFTPLDSGLITGGFKVIRMWEVATGKLARDGEFKGHEAAIKALAITPKGMLASGDQNGIIILWELLTRLEITRFKGHVGEVNGLAFSPNQNLLASAGIDRSVRIWDAKNAKHLFTLDGRCAVYSVVFVDDKTLASGGDDNLIHIWDATTGKHLKEFAVHKNTIVSLARTADGKFLISGSHDKTMRRWDVASGKQVLEITRNAGDCDAMVLSEDNKFLASAGINNTIRRWHADSGKEILLAGGHQSPVTALAISPNGKLLVSGSSMAHMRLWDLESGKQLKTWAGPVAGDLILAFAPNGKAIASCVTNQPGSGNGTDPIRLWDISGGKEIRKFEGPAGDKVLSLTFAPDGKTLAAGYHNQTIRLWDADQAKIISELKYPGPVAALAYSQDGKTLAASGGGKIAIYDAVKGEELRQFGPKDGTPLPTVASIAFSPDGKTLATGSFDGIIRLWDAETGDKLKKGDGTYFELEGHQHVVYALSFSGDGRNLASGSFDRTVKLWEVFSGQQIATWKGHYGSVGSVAMTPNGRMVVSGSADTNLILWDVTGRVVDGKIPPLTMTGPQLQSAWAELAADDTHRANRVLWDLVACGKESVPFLGGQVFLVDPKKIQMLLEDLNNDKFLVRDKATKDLAKYGRWIEDVLIQAQKKPKSEEVRRRLEKLITMLNVPGSLTLDQEKVRLRRIMLVLEQDGSPAARKVLDDLVHGAAVESLRDEAKASLQRLEKRGLRESAG